MNLPDPASCPKILAPLSGGPEDGRIVTVPLHDGENPPDNVKLIESHAHEDDTCMITQLVYILTLNKHPESRVAYFWAGREVLVAGLDDE